MADRPADAVGPAGLVERLWEGRAGRAGALLGPLLTIPELAFWKMVFLRDFAYRAGILRSHPAPVPAISVGNLTVGGTGKTPFVRWLVTELSSRGATPGILHGGYADDEPALHRRWFPDLAVVTGRDRVRGAEEAVAGGADVLVLDDAFQHRRIRRDLDVVLVAAERWTDRPRLLPRGPYREPLRALKRADVVVVTRRRAGPDEAAAVARTVRERTPVPVAVVHLAPAGWLTMDGAPREGSPGAGVAVAAIGQPDAFFRQVEAQGVRLAARLAFRDHHEYGPDDLEGIREAAGGQAVITTAKDAVKLATWLADADVWVLDQSVQFDEGREAVVAAWEETVG